MFPKIKWLDAIFTRPRTYTRAANGDGSETFTPAFGTRRQAGTPLNAVNLNRIEDGVADADALAAVVYTSHQARLRGHDARLGALEDYGELAKKLEGNWVYPETIQNATNGEGAERFRYRKIGRHVYITGNLTMTYAGNSLTVFTMPEGFRPARNRYFIAPLSGKRLARWYAFADGRIALEWAINIDGASNYTASSWYDVALDYYTD